MGAIIKSEILFEPTLGTKFVFLTSINNQCPSTYILKYTNLLAISVS
ncbi:MAG: hypothetical protein ACI917_000639, partial [Patiriisocius sp.]